MTNIAGGESNTIEASYAAVGGGQQNRVIGNYGTVSGEYNNVAEGWGSSVGGGENGYAYGSHSAVDGSYGNIAHAAFTLVFGQNVSPANPETHRVYFFGSGSGSPSGFLVLNRQDGDYPIHVGEASWNGHGASLSGGGVWTKTSSRSKKDRFQQLDPLDVLNKLQQLLVEG